MNLLGPVSEIMTSNPITLSPSATIGEAAHIFNNHKIHHIPVTLGGELHGIVSKSDFLFFQRGFLDNREDKQLEDARMNNYAVSYIMTKGVARLQPTDRINVALDIFQKNLFHAIPVVKDSKLVGIVTTHDIIYNLAKDNVAYAEYE